MRLPCENAVMVASPVDYEELTVQIVMNSIWISQLQREEGEKNIKIEFFEPVDTTVLLDKFVDFLKKAKEEILIRSIYMEPPVDLEYQERNTEKELIFAKEKSAVEIWINRVCIGLLQKMDNGDFELAFSTKKETSIYLDEFLELIEEAKKNDTEKKPKLK